MRKFYSWVQITEVANSNLEGIEDIVIELKRCFIVQYKKKWLPAYCTGFEFWVNLFTNVSLCDIIRDGIVYEAVKRLVLKPLIKSLEKVAEYNKGMDFEDISLEFDDVKIVIENLEGSKIGIVSMVFTELIKAVPFLKSKGIDNISEIYIPANYSSNIDDKQVCNDCSNVKDSVFIWRVIYDFGCSELFFNAKEKIIYE